MPKIVMVSGGFDPIHSGHIYLIREASKHGGVIVLLNSDKWLKIYWPPGEYAIIKLLSEKIIKDFL